MKKIEAAMKALSTIFIQFAETGLALVAAIVVAYLLLGEESGDFVISVVTNVAMLVGAITPAAFVAGAIIVGLFYMIRHKI